MTDQKILDAIRPMLKDGKLPCRSALDFAAQQALSPSQIGKICNQNDIRIVNCQLGCFGTESKKREG